MLAAPRMPEIALEPRPGDSLGPYRITRVIGRGRMGIVFEGTADGEEPGRPEGRDDRALAGRGVPAALPPRGRGGPEDHASRTWCRCSPHGEEGGLPYLVQRLIPGGSLADRIAVRGRLELPYAVALLRRRRRRDRRAARRRARAPRHQAGEHPARRRHAVRVRLRARQGQPGLEPDAAGPGARVARLHVARADPRRGRQPRHRHLLARLRDVGVPDRRAAVRRPAEHARAVRPPAGGAAGPSAMRPRDLAGGRARRHARAREGAGGPARRAPRRTCRALPAPPGCQLCVYRVRGDGTLAPYVLDEDPELAELVPEARLRGGPPGQPGGRARGAVGHVGRARRTPTARARASACWCSTAC